jgi:hypothetical protein
MHLLSLCWSLGLMRPNLFGRHWLFWQVISRNSTWEVRCLDAKYERLTFEKTVERVKAYQPDVIGLTAFTNEIKPSAYRAD